MNNKRIHELLELIKYWKDPVPSEGVLIIPPEYVQEPDWQAITLEILQHLLEVDIEQNHYRQWCKIHLIDYENIYDDLVNDYFLTCPSCLKENNPHNNVKALRVVKKSQEDKIHTAGIRQYFEGKTSGIYVDELIKKTQDKENPNET